VATGVYPFEGGQPRKVFDVPRTFDIAVSPVWSPGGGEVQFVDTRMGVSNIWSHRLHGGPPRQITHFKADRIFSFAWSKDGKRLALARGSITSDAVLITNFK